MAWDSRKRTAVCCHDREGGRGKIYRKRVGKATTLGLSSERAGEKRLAARLVSPSEPTPISYLSDDTFFSNEAFHK